MEGLALYASGALPGPVTRRIINPPELKDARSIGYNHAIVQDGTFYMAGQVAMDGDSEVVAGDIEGQARKVWENIGILLDEVDREYADIAKVTTHIIDPQEHYDGYKEVYWEVFGDGPYPCHTVLGVESLAHEEYLVEVEVEVPLADAE